MEISRTESLATCPTCGARSSNLLTTWPEPKFLPRRPLAKWKFVDWCPHDYKTQMDWSALSARGILNCSCIVCATVVSVLLDARKKYGCHVRIRGSFIQTHLIPATQRYLLTLNGVKILPGEWLNDLRADPSIRAQHDDITSSISIEPLASTLPVAYEPCQNIPMNSGSPKAFELVKRWLHVCRMNHTKCAFTSESYTPSRILDISHENPKLILREDLRDAIEYVALSHCWGISQPLKTVRGNIDSHRKGIPLKSLPATFRDAVKVTKMIGLRYLWIDSLCILQEKDKEDWEREANQMGKVYGSAELVLAATVASSPDAGFLRNRPEFDLGHASALMDGQTIPIESKYHLIFEHDSIYTGNGPLDRRAWAFQERLLARRYLAYGSSEARWECRQDSFCECGLVSTEAQSSDRGRSLDNMLITTPPSGRKELWINICRTYAQRKLTVASDKLVALSAVASRFQSKYGDTYLAGLWKENLIPLLLWWPGRNGKPVDFYAPSWSWVSVDTNFLSFDASIEESSTLATVVDGSVTTSTANKFGTVSKRHIRLRGRAFGATLHTVVGKDLNEAGYPSYQPRYPWGGCTVEIPGLPPAEPICLLDTLVVAHDSKGDNVRYAEAPARRISFAERIPEREYLARYSALILPLLFDDMVIFSLVLGPSPKQPGCLERLGLFIWKGKIEREMRNFLEGFEEDEFVIV